MKRGKIILLIVAALSILAVPRAHSQIPIRRSVTQLVPPDSADIQYYGQRHFWRAAGQVVGFNIGLWAVDRYICKSDFAYINFHTIQRNLKHGFVWDTDQLGTNMFLHPYTGSLYFNAARSDGYSFWGSGLFAIGGSAMWELFMENEYPSLNDIIATPIGGMCIGEVTNRAADAMKDDRTRGLDRALREAGIFIVSPMTGLTRLMTGDMWRVRSTTGKCFGTPNLALEASVGTSLLNFRHDDSPTRVGAVVKLNMEYGDRFEVKSKKPYDYFTMSGTLTFMKEQPALHHISIVGRLMARELFDDERTHLSVGLFQHFDYYDSDTINGGAVPYKLGVPACVGGGIYYRNLNPGKAAFDAFLHVNGVMLGTVLSDHFKLGDRNYNLGAGFSTKVGVNLVLNSGKIAFSAKNELYRLYTWRGYSKNTDLAKANEHELSVMGDKSTAMFSVTSLRGDFKIKEHLYASISLEHYLRHTSYRDFPDVTSSSLGAQVMLTYKF